MSEEVENIDSTQVLNSLSMFIEKIHTNLEKKVEEQQAEIDRLQKLLGEKKDDTQEFDKKVLDSEESDKYSSSFDTSLEGYDEGEDDNRVRERVAKSSQVGQEDQIMNYLSIIQLNKPIERPKFYLTYNSITDKYQSSVDEFNGKQDWLSLTYKTSNLNFHRERYDPFCNYIARNEACSHKQVGTVKWRFNMENLDNNWSRIELIIHGKVWIGTSIESFIIGHQAAREEEGEGDSKTIEKKLLLNSLNVITKEDLEDPLVIEIVCHLKGLNVDVTNNPRKHHLYPQLFMNWTQSSDTEREAFIFKIY